MAINDFEYYQSLRRVLTDSLLHLLIQVAHSERFVPVEKRNDILTRYLKPKLKQKAWANVKKDIRVMIQIGRKQNGNLERRMYELLNVSKNCDFDGVQKLYDLLVYLDEKEGFPSQLFESDDKVQAEVLYVLEDHIEHCFENKKQVAPVSVLLQSERAPTLVDIINKRDAFKAELHEWNSDNNQAHLLLHPN